MCYLTQVKALQNIHGYYQVCWYKFEEVWELLLKLLCLLSFLLPSVLLPVCTFPPLLPSQASRGRKMCFSAASCRLTPGCRLVPEVKGVNRSQSCSFPKVLGFCRGPGYAQQQRSRETQRRDTHSICLQNVRSCLASCPDSPMQYLGPKNTFSWRRSEIFRTDLWCFHHTQQCSSRLISESSTSLCTNHDTSFSALLLFLFVCVSATTQSLTIGLDWKLALSQVIIGFILVDRPTWAVLLWILNRLWDQIFR